MAEENEKADPAPVPGGPGLRTRQGIILVSLSALLLLLLLLFAITPSRRLILDGLSYSLDSFHSLSDTRFYFERAVAYSEKGRDRLAIRTFERITKRSLPSDSMDDRQYRKQALFNIGVIYYTLGQNLGAGRKKTQAACFERASAVWDRYLAVNENDRKAGLSSSLDETNAARIIEARTYVDSLDEIPRDPKAKYYKDLGQKEYYNRNIAKALEYYLKAVRIDPTYDTAYNNAGAMFFYLGEEKARALAAPGLAPRQRTTISNTALSNFRGAIAYWEKALLLNPKDNRELYLSIAGVYQQYFGDMELAVRWLKEHLRNNPKDPQNAAIGALISDYESGRAR